MCMEGEKGGKLSWRGKGSGRVEVSGEVEVKSARSRHLDWLRSSDWKRKHGGGRKAYMLVAPYIPPVMYHIQKRAEA